MVKKEALTINADDFKLTHSHENKWDLIFAKVVYANDPEKRRVEFKSVDSYGITIDTSIRKIINRRIVNFYEEGIVFTFEEYTKEYKKQLVELTFVLNYKNYNGEE